MTSSLKPLIVEIIQSLEALGVTSSLILQLTLFLISTIGMYKVSTNL